MRLSMILNEERISANISLLSLRSVIIRVETGKLWFSVIRTERDTEKFVV